MKLKMDCCRPVPGWLMQLHAPSLETEAFPLTEVLKQSLYYPAACVDGRPVQFLGGFVHSFIYVDYGVEQSFVYDMTRHDGFRGYHLAGSKRLNEHDLAPHGWAPVVPPEYQDQITRFGNMKTFAKAPFANWYIFDRDDDQTEEHGPQRFSLVYLSCDGIAGYQALYWQNSTAPEVLAIIQPGTGFGGNYTDFRDPAGFLAWTVLRGNGPHRPEYLVCGGSGLNYTEAFWPEAYPEHVEWFQKANGNGVWRRRELT